MNDISPYNGEEDEPIVGDAPPRAHVFFSNSVYDKLKFVAAVVLPALAVFYIAVAPLWGWPKQEEVSGTIMAIDLLLGTLLGLSSLQYKNHAGRFDGNIIVYPEEEDGTNVRFQMDDPSVLLDKDEVTVRVRRPRR